MANKFEWEDLPKPLNVFTARSTFTRDLNSKKLIQCYSSNTRLTIVQKCVTPGVTYYRTGFAARNGLDWAFEASAFGLPNEVAPLAQKSLKTHSCTSGVAAPKQNTNSSKTVVEAKSGEPSQSGGILGKLARFLKKKRTR